MENIDFFKMFYTAVGGLGIFFLGLRFLSESLQSMAGSFIQRLINVATSNRFTAVIVGIVVTMIVQSSSISTVMVVGLVNAGLMKLTQAIGVILGANIGTTVTGWILVLKVGKYGLLLIGLGVFPMLFSKRSKFSSAGKCLLALGLIFLGLSFMSGAFKPLRGNAEFISYLAYFDATSLVSVLGCVLIGCLLTFVIQSSSAMLGITIAMASTGTITFPTAAALVLGENIGTTITALLAGIGTNTSAKRAALSHAIFNICGVAILCVFFQPYLKLVDWVVPGVPDLVSADGSKDLISAHIAMGHTLFNVTATLIALPVLGYLAQLVEFLVPAKDEPEEHHLQYIGSAGNSNSAVALSMAELELQNMIKIVAEIFDESDRYLRTKSHDQALLDSLSRHEKITDNINEEITSFCCRVIEGGLTAEQSVRAYTIIRAASELESLADYCHSIASYRHRLYRNKLDFSEKAWEEITTFFSQVHEFFSTVSASLNELEPQLISKWNQHAIALNKDADILRDGHIARMRKGSCKPLPAITFSDLAVAMRRVKNHTVNLYEALGYHTIDIEANQD